MWKILIGHYGEILIASFIVAIIFLIIFLFTKKDVLDTSAWYIILVISGLLNLTLGILGLIAKSKGI